LASIEEKKERAFKREPADALLRSGRFKEAAELYSQLVAEDTSLEDEEYFFSNWSLALLKGGEFEKCFEICQRGLEVYEKFRDSHGMRETFNRASLMEGHTSPIEYKLKLMYRQADAKIKAGKIEEGEQKIKEILRIDELNEEARILQEKLVASQRLKESIETKKQGNSLVQQKKFREALQKYSQALGGIDRSTDFNEYLAVLMNQTVCHMELKLWDELIATATRALSLLEMQRARVMKFEGEKKTQEKEYDKFTERLWVRRGNAYLEKGQIYNAKLDLAKVVELNPSNQEVKGTLEKLGKFENKDH
jgi:tetratricopeptide (TPR) repeat protein